jgi:hypothetical protein
VPGRGRERIDKDARKQAKAGDKAARKQAKADDRAARKESKVGDRAARREARELAKAERVARTEQRSADRVAARRGGGTGSLPSADPPTRDARRPVVKAPPAGAVQPKARPTPTPVASATPEPAAVRGRDKKLDEALP